MKYFIKLLNEIKFDTLTLELNYNPSNYTKKNYLNFNLQARGFHTSPISYDENNLESKIFTYDSELENLTYNQKIQAWTDNPELYKKLLAYEKAKKVKEFKKMYKGGYLGYSQIHHFGNIMNWVEIIEYRYSW